MDEGRRRRRVRVRVVGEVARLSWVMRISNPLRLLANNKIIGSMVE
jgi:hypothetical protein